MEGIQTKLAEAQLIGFGHASKGYSIIELIEAMGLSKSEWIEIREGMKTLKAIDKDAIDESFNLTN